MRFLWRGRKGWRYEFCDIDKDARRLSVGFGGGGRAAMGILWLLWRRHRWGLAVVALMLCVGSIVARVGDWGAPMKVAVVFPLLFGLVYLITVFVYEEGKDLAARESGFPAYLWVLPVSTVELVGWSMGLGVAKVALGWVLVAELVMKPMGIPASTAWPAALLGAIVASVQAMLWAPLPLPFLRVVLVCMVLVALVTVGIGGRETWGISEGRLVAIYSVVIVMSFVVALRGVDRARHGEEARWQWLPGFLLEGGGSGAVRRGRAFASAAGAQLWMEWRRNGIMLVLACCAMWALMLAPLMWQWRYGEGMLAVDAKQIMRQLAALLSIPLLLSMVMGAGPRQTLSSKRDMSMSSFMATRPIGVGTFVWAKLWRAALATALVWGVALGMVGTLMLFPVKVEGGTRPMGAIVAEAATTRHVLVACAVLVAVIGVTWKFQIEGIFILLFGRAWVAQTYSIGVGAFCVGGCILVAWLVGRPDVWGTVATVTRWGAVGLCVVKVMAWVWVARELVGRGFASRAMVGWGSAAWLSVVVGVSAAALALAPGEVGRVMIVAGVVLLMPLVRLGAAPLALASNRHR